MIEFKKYNSIENSFNTEYMEKVVAQVPPDMKWVVQEKVHGTNTSFLCDGQDVKFAKRTSRLADDEKFYDYAELLERYRNRVISLFNRVKKNHPDVRAMEKPHAFDPRGHSGADPVKTFFFYP